MAGWTTQVGWLPAPLRMGAGNVELQCTALCHGFPPMEEQVLLTRTPLLAGDILTLPAVDAKGTPAHLLVYTDGDFQR